MKPGSSRLPRRASRMLRWPLMLGGLVSLAQLAAQGALAQAGPTAPAGPPPSTSRLVMAYYHYAYQGDPRKGVPTQGVRTDKGLSLLTDQPWESVGPWMSYDRAQWHKNNFQMMAAGGIDVALAVYRGDKAGRRTHAIKGLDVMVQGLKELRFTGAESFTRPREYPQIGLALDLGGLQEQYGGPVDLKVPDVQRSLYGMIRDFYLHLPEEFRATVQLPAGRQAALPAAVGSPTPAIGSASTSRGVAYIVRLCNDAAVKDADPTVLAYVNRRFAQEFGARLVWVGTPGLRARVAGFDAVAPYPAAGAPAVVNGDGWIKTGSIGPGFDNTGMVAGGSIRPRDNGQQALLDFKKVMSENVDWVLIDSWNGFSQGSDIAPSLQYGLLYRDLIRAGVLQYKQSADYAADFLKATAPRVMMPGQVYQVEVVVQNSGTYDWDVFNVASLSYRWLKDGKYVPGETAGMPSNGQMRGEKKSFLVGVAPPVKDGQPAPAGEYELEFNMTRRVGDELTWFDQSDAAPFRVPVTIAPPPPSRPFFINSTMPTLVRRGAVYPAQVRVRNDGSDAWKKGAVTLGYRWRKCSTYLKGLADDADAVVIEGKRAPLDADVGPGRMVTVDVPVATSDTAGQPMTTWTAADDWCWVLEFDVHDGRQYLSTAGGATLREPVEVTERDPSAAFIGCNLSQQLIAGRTEKVTVGLVNTGPDAWKKGRDKVAVHWYYMDGTEASWNDDLLPLQEDVAPFSRALVDVPDDLGEKLFGAEPPKEDKKRDKDARRDEPKRDKKEDKDKKGKHRTRKEWMVQPTVLRDVPVRVPYYFGPMYCVFDFQQDGLNASTGAATKGNDILVIPVNVYSPTFTPLPGIQGFFNVDGVSQDVDRGDGNIDGRGNSLPAEFLPPYVPRPSVGGESQGGPLYPSGLWVRPLNDLSASRACFWYPNKNNQAPNMIACQGQKIEFPGLGRNAVHVLALCTEENQKGDFSLYYSDGTVERKSVAFTHWNDPPKNGELVAFSTPHRHTRAGDDSSTRCYLNQYILPTDRLKLLVGLELPRNTAVKVMAVTLESAGLRNPAGG